MPLSMNLRPLAAVALRTITRRVRPYSEAEPMDVCAQWRWKHWRGQSGPPLYTERRLLHVTLCAHEGLRPVYLRRIAKLAATRPEPGESKLLRNFAAEGVFFSHFKYTRRISIFFFVFCLSIEWCWKPSIEKVDVMDVAREAARH